jgi:hypothetical protein
MSRKNNSGIFPIGKTTDGKIVVDGVWEMYETHGLPLDIIFSICMEKDWVPSWIDIYLQMKKSGMDHDRILSKLEESISDSFGKEFCMTVISKLELIFEIKENK